jgi:hypothetical protein
MAWAVALIVGTLAASALAATIGRTDSAAGYPSQLGTAAKALESAVAPGGPGYRFDVVQRQVEYPKAGASDLPIVDAESPQVIVGRVDHLYVNSVLARGRVGPGVFWMEMRFGPDETTTPDYDVAPTMFGVIAKNGSLWRNDGLGWYATTVSPGVGMDPTSASLLPTLLRNIANVSDQGADVIAGQSAHRYRGHVDVTVFPGVVASDGAAFTETPIGVDVWLDGSNRLIALEGRARNLNESTLDLKVVTRIFFTYEAAGAAPDASPLAPSPSASGVTVGVP